MIAVNLQKWFDSSTKVIWSEHTFTITWLEHTLFVHVVGGVQTGDLGEAAFARASSSINSFSCFNISFFSSFFFGLTLMCNFFFFFRAFLTLMVHAEYTVQLCAGRSRLPNQTLYTNLNKPEVHMVWPQSSPRFPQCISSVLWFAFNTWIQKNPLFCFHIQCRLINKLQGKPGKKATYAALCTVNPTNLNTTNQTYPH